MKHAMDQISWIPVEFPFYAATVEGVQGDSRVLHWHKEMEILRVRRGGGTHLINGREYEANVGDIFFIGYDEIHLLFHEHDHLQVQVFMFRPDFVCATGADLFDKEYLLPFLSETGLWSRVPAGSPLAQVITPIMDELEWLYSFQGLKASLRIKAKLLQLLAEVVEYGPQDQQIMSPDFRPLQTVGNELHKANTNGIRRAMEMIEENYQNNMNLDQLAKEADMSVSHFSSTFCRYTNTSPIEFLIRCRLSAAKNLLKTSNKRILEIAAECGFDTLSNFNKAFRTRIGMTPSAYRKA